MDQPGSYIDKHRYEGLIRDKKELNLSDRVDIISSGRSRNERPSRRTDNDVHKYENYSKYGKVAESLPPQKARDILRLPIESSYAYSYVHLSHNSLAFRLNVLKRSLEILAGRPELLHFMDFGKREPFMHDNSDENRGPNRWSEQDEIETQDLTKKMTKTRIPNKSPSKINNDGYFPELFKPSKPNMRRAVSFNIGHESHKNKPGGIGQNKNSEAPIRLEDVILKENINEIIRLLDLENGYSLNATHIASTLHDLSLGSGNRSREKLNNLQSKLLYALATPFVEKNLLPSPSHPRETPLGSPDFDSSSMPTHSMFQAVDRPFHYIISGKNSLPQAIFSIEAYAPWQVRSANDLALLIFGVQKETIKTLSLMELIAPQFRKFVYDTLVNQTKDASAEQNFMEDVIIFAGEVVAIKQPGNQDVAWTAIWATKKSNVIVFVFDRLSCDSLDVKIQRKSGEDHFTIDSMDFVVGDWIEFIGDRRGQKLDKLSESMAMDLENEEETDILDHYLHSTAAEEDKLNKTRYYTLQLTENSNIPCAVTSIPIQDDEHKKKIGLSIHFLPYIAGLFVIDSDFRILSCNNAITNNIFGRSASEVINKSIDFLIPDLRSIFWSGIKSYSKKLDMIPGLVLPEHFFRKYYSILNNKGADQKSQEDSFIACNGIKGLHRDGKPILIDVQLRVISIHVSVLWITYSRINTVGAENKKSGHNPLMSLTTQDVRRERKHNRRFTYGYAAEPTQRSIVPEELQLLAPNNEELSRKSSTREPSSNNQQIGLSRARSIVEKTGEEISSSNGTDQEMFDETNGVYIKEDTVDTFEEDKSSDIDIKSNLEKNYNDVGYSISAFRKFSEEEVLQMENKKLEERKNISHLWPVVIGGSKRTKKFTEFRKLKSLGEGAYGSVLLAEHVNDPHYRVAIKCIDKEKILVDTWVRDRKLGTICSEIQIMAFLNDAPHPNIPRLVDFFEDSKFYYLETTIFGDPPAIDLFDYIEVRQNLTELECKFIFKQIVLAVCHLHKNGIVHRDIKDENVIVDRNGLIKLIDFGSASYTKQGPFDVFVGTIDYASPEVLRGEKYTGKPQDIWALGVLLYSILLKENPFYNVDEIMGGDLYIPYAFSDAAISLVKRILNRNLADRPTISDIVEDKWLDI